MNNKEVPFGIPQYVQCILVPLVFHSSLLIAKNINLMVAHDGFLCVTEIDNIFIFATLITEVLFKQFLIHTTVQQTENS